MSLFENSRWRQPQSWKIHKRAYLGRFLTNLYQIWSADIYGQFKCHQRQKSTFRKFKMAAAAILKIHKRVYLSQFFIDLHQIWYVYRYGRYKCHQRSKMSLFGKSRWRRPPFWKIHKGHISANFWSICTKFCMLVDIGNVVVQNSTLWKFKIAAVAVLEILKTVYLGQLLTNLHRICMLINTGNTRVTSGP